MQLAISKLAAISVIAILAIVAVIGIYLSSTVLSKNASSTIISDSSSIAQTELATTMCYSSTLPKNETDTTGSGSTQTLVVDVTCVEFCPSVFMTMGQWTLSNIKECVIAIEIA